MPSAIIPTDEEKEIHNRLERFASNIQHSIQINHILWKKQGNDFVATAWEDEKAFIEDAKQFATNILNCKKVPQKENLKYFYTNPKTIQDFFERREPIIIPHNGHKYGRTRKMNLRPFSTAITMLFAQTEIGINKLDIAELMNEVNKQNTIIVLDIFDFYSSLDGKFIRNILTSDKKILENHCGELLQDLLSRDSFPGLSMDNLADHSLARAVIRSIFKERIAIDLMNEFPVKKILFGVDEIAIVVDREFAKFSEIEANIDIRLKALSGNTLFLNKSKTKIVTYVNFEFFANEANSVSLVASEMSAIGNPLRLRFAGLEALDVFRNIRHYKPFLMKDIIRETTIHKIEITSRVADAFNDAYDGKYRNDLELFFAKVLIPNRHL